MAWLSGWKHRVKLTIDSGVIDTANLSNFPILLYISTDSGKTSKDISFVFDELASDSNRKKIAVTTSDGTTECYVEIERWDDANEKAWLWVKVPTVSYTEDTDLYLYYDANHADNTTHVGDTNSTPAENVWDSNFKMVQHMRDATTSTITDSTSNNNDGTKGAASNPSEVAAKIDKGQNYNANTETIQMGDVLDFEYNQPFTIEAWGKHSVANRISQIVSKVEATGNYRGWSLWKWNSSYGHFMELSLTNTSALEVCVYGSTALNDNAWHYLAGSYNGNHLASGVALYVDAVRETEVTRKNNLGTNTTVSAATLAIGNRDTPATHNQAWDGDLDEIRVSNVARTAGWIKASYYSGADNLLTWGSEESGGWANIAKIQGVNATDLKLVNGVAVADIAKVNGVAV